MKKIFSLLTLVLAINCLALAGGLGWLYKAGKIDRDKLTAIKEILFPKEEVAAPTTQPDSEEPASPLVKLETLLASASGKPAGEQVEIMQQSFDAQMAQLDRKHRELLTLQQQIELARNQLTRDRSKYDQEKTELTKEKEEATRLASDKGFQDTLTLYNTLPSKQVKTIFMSLEDGTVQRYLQAMQPRTASKIVKEFKTPEEVARIQSVLEKIRKSELAAQKP